MRALVLIAALALAGCAGGNTGMFGGGNAKPDTIVVPHFDVIGNVVILDKGFSTRIQRAGVQAPHQIREQLYERVGREVAATVIAELNAAGLQAQAGEEDDLPADKSVLLVKGSVRGMNPATQRNAFSFGGAGKNEATADVVVSSYSGGSKKNLLTFIVEPEPRAARGVTPRSAVAVTAQGEKLSPDVEATARRMGRAIALKVIAYATEQGWLAKPAT